MSIGVTHFGFWLISLNQMNYFAKLIIYHVLLFVQVIDKYFTRNMVLHMYNMIEKLQVKFHTCACMYFESKSQQKNIESSDAFWNRQNFTKKLFI